MNPEGLWICKPTIASSGNGIRILKDTTVVPNRKSVLDSYIISDYIINPHLIDGFKYDLRIYVLVTSFDPLKLYIYDDGLVRFCTEKYSNDVASLKNTYIHLTNTSINKKNKERSN